MAIIYLFMDLPLPPIYLWDVASPVNFIRRIADGNAYPNSGAFQWGSLRAKVSGLGILPFTNHPHLEISIGRSSDAL